MNVRIVCCLCLGLTVGGAMGQSAKWLSVPSQVDAMEKASWIWIQRPGDAVPTTSNGAQGVFTFERTFQAMDTSRATLRFTADNLCRAFVNGREVGSSAEWSQIQTLNVTDAIKPGSNRLTMVVTNTTLPPGSMNPGGLLACLELTDRSGSTQAILTDAKWEADGGKVAVLGPASSAPWSQSFRNAISPIFRKEFTLRTVPKEASIEAIGLGHYQLFLNGKRLGEAAINQPWSQYDRTLYSRRFDLTPHLVRGRNVLAAMIGGSFYSVARPPAGRYAKGDAMPDFGGSHPVRLWIQGNAGDASLGTDVSWRWTEGPVTLAHIFAGEDYDATKDPKGWMKPGFDDSTWRRPEVLAPPTAQVVPQFWPELKVLQTFRPVAILPAPKGGWTYKFAQNCSAILKFRVRGPKGATVAFQLSEVVQDNGDVEQLNLWNAVALTSYTLSGEGAETYQNLFFYHGGQFVGVQGAVPKGQPNPNGLPVLESLELLHVRTDNKAVSAFRSSSALANDTVGLIDWAMRSNMSFVLTDCPHREKLGWLECAHLLANSFAYRYDCQAWFHKICRDLRDSQLPTGRVLTVAPRYLMRPDDDGYAWTVEWGAASVLLPWQAYQWYGDRRFLVENLPMMRAFVDHLTAFAKDGIAPGSLGDWYDYGHGQPPGPSRYTDTRLTATATYALCADALSRAAAVLGDSATAQRYAALRNTIKTAFLREFYDPIRKTFANRGSVQTGHAMALYADLVPEADRMNVLKAIVDELEQRDYQQTSGDVGHLYLIRALAEAGRSDVLHKVYSRTGLGSYGGILAKGLTAMPETWDAITVGSNSLNHCMLGHAMEWFYGYVLGVRQTPGSVGWAEIDIAPVPGGMASCSGHLETPRGRIEVEWKREGGGLVVEFVLPKGVGANCGGQRFTASGRHRVTLPTGR